MFENTLDCCGRGVANPSQIKLASQRVHDKVGVLVSSGKAYYQLVSELQRRKIIHIPLLPSEKIPLDVRVVIASPSLVRVNQQHEVIFWTKDSNPREVVDQTIRRLYGEENFSEVTIGVDPGKDIGLAVVADGKVLQSDVLRKTEEAVEEILLKIASFTCSRRVVKIGSGAGDYGENILSMLLHRLPENVEIQKVEEWGTTKNALNWKNSRRALNTASATQIALRQGKILTRGK